MLNSLLGPNIFLWVLFFLLCLTSLILILYDWLVYFRLARYKDKTETRKEEGVSVVICARNEYYHLQDNLPAILSQDYPNFEVIVVNNSSDDDSSFLLSQMAEKDHRLKIVEIQENLNFFNGKKFPLSIGIKSAKNDLILLIDADCKPSSDQWIRKMQQSFDKNIKVVLGYGAYARRKGLLNILIRFDTVQIAIQYLSWALAGSPYMGVGRNMAYRKSLFYENQGFISHYKILSGDDDLFVNRVSRKNNTHINIDPQSITLSEPETKFSNWVIQKRRHLSTGKYYRFKHKLMLGTHSVSEVLFWGLTIGLVSILYNWIIILSIFVVRTTSQLIVNRKCMRHLGEKRLWGFSPLLSLEMILLNTIFAFLNIVNKKNRWK
ncbi:MAG: glycosyltransferase [Bacteroidota bacterium]|nr:glycosyltransferase [Bacteroidota bacterium]